ncbi:hypothetical protein THAOC_09468 [Thalassiosira oceanica]|uniref:DUF6743 domain-containing protein n=1 Tax=Thalassiosira oceanica TaxID=159749 RepID=K0SV37_THAOC|nr:hypothetical protein THAOC_09468 [Thalassiosira oceanica]|eukprot:EJK69285.1 hypothetical protein THAOC_09468 [Thalassiosira oceanica]
MRTSKEWMREDTWHFKVEVLRIYGRQELWSHGFGARPVSDGPYQPVDATDVRRRVAFGARQDNEFAVRHCCVHRSRWPVVSGARVPRGTSKPLVTTSSASEREEAVRPQIEFSAIDLSPEKDLQHRLEVLALATDGEESCPMEGRPFQRLQAQRRAVGGSRTESSPPCWRVSTPMSQSAGTSGFAPAWGVHHCPSLQASGGGSSYGSRGRPPDTTGRAVPLTGFPGGFLEEGPRPRIAAAHSPAASWPLESRIGPRLYTTSLRLHQPRLIPSTWRGGTTSRLPPPAHNAGVSSRNDKAIDSLVRKQELSSRLEDAECARHRPLESQVGPRLYTTSLRPTPAPTEVDPVYVERTDNFEIASAGTQCR